MNKQSKAKTLILSIGFVIVFVTIFIVLSQLKQFLPENLERYSHGILGTISAFTTIGLFINFEKNKLKDYGIVWEKKTTKRFLVGTVIGVILALTMIFSQVLISGLEITVPENQNIPTFLISIPAILILAFMEELAFRSYPFSKLNKQFGLRTTQFLIAILFALYHLVNGWSIGLSFLGPGIWSLAYGLSAVASNGISMPTGLHSGINIILALFIGKKNVESLWTIDFPTEVSKNMIAANQKVGIIIHVSLLILCIIATEIYLRKKKTTANSIYYS